MIAVLKQLQHYGAPPGSMVEVASALRYRELRDTPISAVVEQSHWPLLYAAEERSLPPAALELWGPRLAMRDETPLLASVGSERIRVYEVGPQRPYEIGCVEAKASDAALMIPSLVSRTFKPGVSPGFVRTRIYQMLTRATDLIRDYLPLHPEDQHDERARADDALSLAGRALFLRFLADRSIVKKKHLAQICPGAKAWADCFASGPRAWKVSRWLDETFNGDLLPLRSTAAAFFGSLDERVLRQLRNIADRAAPSGQGELDWGDLDFAHVPVGVLGEVYEEHVSKHAPADAEATSVHYTPRRIAEYMVRESFAALPDPVGAKVLDPAAGGGVFLISCFRQLAQERLQKTGKPPDRRELRRILYEQIRGFDVNPAALRLAALGLYLTALELDDSPTPLSELRFENLQGRVLFDVRSPAERAAGELLVAGSLGPEVGEEHTAQYDLVIGNPPWTALKGHHPELEATWRATLTAVLKVRRGERAEAPTLPDRAPDLPFLWRATTWAKYAGHVALALPSRLLTKQSAMGRKARHEILSAIRVTGILNGAAVFETNVWPEMAFPWCAIFLENRRPDPEDAFFLINIPQEDQRNARGDFRADLSRAAIVQQRAALKSATLLKTVMAGTALDAKVLGHILAAAPGRLEEVWPESHRGEGYSRESEPNPVRFLTGRPDLTRANQKDKLVPRRLLVEAEKLPKFSRATLNRERAETIYEPPVIIVPLSAPLDRARGRVLFTRDRLAYNKQYFGLSSAWYANPNLLARWTFLVLGSEIVSYLALLTSGEFGLDLDKLQTLDIKRVPFLLPAAFEPRRRRQIEQLSDALFEDAGEETWRLADEFVFQAYGLEAPDIEVIRDTLEFHLPYAPVRKKAQQPTTEAQLQPFLDRLQEMLTPALRGFDRTVDISVTPRDLTARWVVLLVRSVGASSAPASVPSLEALFAREDALSSSLLIHEDARGAACWVAIRNQARYWTPSQARLLALRLLGEHERALLGRTGDRWR